MITLDEMEQTRSKPLVRRGIIREAMIKLNYTPERHVNDVDEKLGDTLDQAMIIPLNTEKVRAYKDDQTKRNKWLYPLLTNGTFVASIAAAAYFSFTVSHYFWFAILGGIVLAMLLEGAFNAWLCIAWKRVKIEEYSKPIPVRVLKNAITLSDALKREGIKNFRFVVEELVVGNKEGFWTALKEDPFLILRVDDQEVYIDVWDEPKFFEDEQE